MIDWTHIELLEARTANRWTIGIWANYDVTHGVAWSHNQIDDCVDLVEMESDE